MTEAAWKGEVLPGPPAADLHQVLLVCPGAAPREAGVSRSGWDVCLSCAAHFPVTNGSAAAPPSLLDARSWTFSGCSAPGLVQGLEGKQLLQATGAGQAAAQQSHVPDHLTLHPSDFADGTEDVTLGT